MSPILPSDPELKNPFLEPKTEDEVSPILQLRHARALSLDTGYALPAGSNRAWGEGMYEAIDAFTAPVDFLGKTRIGDSEGGRAALGISSHALATYGSMRFGLWYHEYGHMTRFRAAGEKDLIFGAEKSTPRRYDARTFDNPMSQLGFLLTHPGYNGGFVGAPSEDETAPEAPLPLNRQDMIISAGGVNNSTHFAEVIEDKAYLEGAHFAQYMPYVFGKFDVGQYALNESTGVFGPQGGDLRRITDYYEQQGYRVPMGRVTLSSLVALGLSGTTYASVLGLSKYIRDGDSTFDSLEIKRRVRFPEIGYYLTSQGPSFKIKSGYALNDNLKLPFAVEKTVQGELETFEMQAGIMGRIPDMAGGASFSYGANALAGSEGFGCDLNAAYRRGFLQIKAGLASHDPRTLHGERHVADLSRNRNWEAWVRASLVY